MLQARSRRKALPIRVARFSPARWERQEQWCAPHGDVKGVTKFMLSAGRRERPGHQDIAVT